MRSTSIRRPTPGWPASTSSTTIFGHAAAALAANAAGIPRLLAFDLALANLFGLASWARLRWAASCAPFCRGFSTRLAVVGGLGAVLLSLLSGNLAALAYWSGRVADDPFFYQGLSWNATRIIRTVEGGGLPPCQDPRGATARSPKSRFSRSCWATCTPTPWRCRSCFWPGYRRSPGGGGSRARIGRPGRGGLFRRRGRLGVATNSWDFPLALGLGPIAGLAAVIARTRPAWAGYFRHVALGRGQRVAVRGAAAALL